MYDFDFIDEEGDRLHVFEGQGVAVVRAEERDMGETHATAAVYVSHEDAPSVARAILQAANAPAWVVETPDGINTFDLEVREDGVYDALSDYTYTPDTARRFVAALLAAADAAEERQQEAIRKQNEEAREDALLQRDPTGAGAYWRERAEKAERDLAALRMLKAAHEKAIHNHYRYQNAA